MIKKNKKIILRMTIKMKLFTCNACNYFDDFDYLYVTITM